MTTQRNLGPITEGDDEPFDLTIRGADGSPLDITGWTVFVTVKDDITDTDANAVISKDITTHDEPENGKTSFKFTSAETADLDGEKEYDVQVKDDNDDISTILRGTVTFEPDVTDRTA
jgi:hypothetical protein